MSWIDWLIVILLNGGVIAYGFYMARGTASSAQWFLAARALPWWGIGLSMFATNVDNADIVSVTGKTHAEGMHIITVYALGSAIGGILASFWIVPAMYRAGHYTNAEYLEARFGVGTRVLSALIQIQYRSSMLGLIIYSMYLLLTQLVAMPPVVAWVLIVALTLFSGWYTAWGGLRSVVWTDALQGVIMMVACLVVFFTVVGAMGGWGEARGALDSVVLEDGRPASELMRVGQFRGEGGRTPPWLIALGWCIIASGYWTVNHTQTMRLMGARSVWDMKMAAIFGVALSLPLMWISASLGVLGHGVPEARDLPKPDMLYPMLAGQYLTVGLKGLVVAGVVAAAISTFDSMGSALSAIFTRDIYARLLAPRRDDRHYVRVGRYTTVAVLLLGFLYLPFILLQDTMIKAFTTLIPVFVTPLLTLYLAGVFTPASRRSGIVGLICGGCYGVVALWDREVADLTVLPWWFTGQWFAFPWSVAFTTAAITLTTLLKGGDPPTLQHARPDERDASRNESEPGAATPDHHDWLARSAERMGVIREHPFESAVPVWLWPRWYAIVLLAATAYIVFGWLW